MNALIFNVHHYRTAKRSCKPNFQKLLKSESEIPPPCEALAEGLILKVQAAVAEALQDETRRLRLQLTLEHAKLKSNHKKTIAHLADLCNAKGQQTQIYSFSKAHVEQKLAKFRAEGRDHLEVKPVYLGFTEYKNLRGPVPSAVMRDLIVACFRGMTFTQGQHHPLRDFFQWCPKNLAYIPKMVHIKAGQTQIMFDVDHVVPKRWAGIDHPRNYVVMHQSMNRSFGDEKPELKMAYCGVQSQCVLRKVAEFTRRAFGSKALGGAMVQYLETDMDEW